MHFSTPALASPCPPGWSPLLQVAAAASCPGQGCGSHQCLCQVHLSRAHTQTTPMTLGPPFHRSPAPRPGCPVSASGPISPPWWFVLGQVAWLETCFLEPPPLDAFELTLAEKRICAGVGGGHTTVGDGRHRRGSASMCHSVLAAPSVCPLPDPRPALPRLRAPLTHGDPVLPPDA